MQITSNGTIFVGDTVGSLVGSLVVGAVVGKTEGAIVGEDVGASVGMTEGARVEGDKVSGSTTQCVYAGLDTKFEQRNWISTYLERKPLWPNVKSRKILSAKHLDLRLATTRRRILADVFCW